MKTIIDLLALDRINPKKVAGTHGGEYASACPKCGGVDRFRCWPEQDGNGGTWWCRQCNKGGDCIQFLRKLKGMNYADACAYLGQEIKQSHKSAIDKPVKGTWTPRKIEQPQELWLEKAQAFVKWAHDNLFENDEQLSYLQKERGLSMDTIKAAKLGWNPSEMQRDRKVFGLPPVLNDKGTPKKVWLPKGLIIPHFTDNQLQRVRFRLAEKNKINIPYIVLPGSSMECMALGSNKETFLIVESELDAWLLYQECQDLASIVSLGNAQSRPDEKTAELLRGAKLILIALDSDNPGAKEAWHWWPEYFEQSRRCPPIDGKDPGEMWKAAIPLRIWVEVAIEKYTTVSKPQDTPSPIVANQAIFQKMYMRLCDELNEFYIQAGIIEKKDMERLNHIISTAYPRLERQIDKLESKLNQIWINCDSPHNLMRFKNKLEQLYQLRLLELIYYRKHRLKVKY